MASIERLIGETCTSLTWKGSEVRSLYRPPSFDQGDNDSLIGGPANMPPAESAASLQ